MRFLIAAASAYFALFVFLVGAFVIMTLLSALSAEFANEICETYSSKLEGLMDIGAPPTLTSEDAVDSLLVEGILISSHATLMRSCAASNAFREIKPTLKACNLLPAFQCSALASLKHAAARSKSFALSMLLMIFANGSVPRDENGCEVDDKVPAPFDIFLIIC